MSLVCLQYGQCGNQVSSDLFNSINDDILSVGRSSTEYVKELTDKWFDVDDNGVRKARAVPIDTEKKAVAALKFSSKSSWSYNPRWVATCNTGGSGNNWALGFYENGLELTDSILNVVDKVAEGCDNGLDGILSVIGLGGGTGSGLSCFVNRSLSDHYPKVTKSTLAILPFSEGEVCTQPYNTLLSITKLYETQTGVFLISNDYLYKKCMNLLKIKSVKMSDMNQILSEQLACSLSVGKMSQLVDHLSCHPSFKLISLRSTPHVPSTHAAFESTPSWTSLISNLKLSLVKSEDYDLRNYSRSLGPNQRSHQYYKCVANLLTCRGLNSSEAQFPTDNHPLNDSSIYPHWFPHKPQFLFAGNNKKFGTKERFACLLTTSGFPHRLLEPVLDNALTLFNHQAFLHHYTKYGMDSEYFLDSFSKFEQILKDYKSLL